jgi:hypothetical protein
MTRYLQRLIGRALPDDVLGEATLRSPAPSVHTASGVDGEGERLDGPFEIVAPPLPQIAASAIPGLRLPAEEQAKPERPPEPGEGNRVVQVPSPEPASLQLRPAVPSPAQVRGPARQPPMPSPESEPVGKSSLGASAQQPIPAPVVKIELPSPPGSRPGEHVAQPTPGVRPADSPVEQQTPAAIPLHPEIEGESPQPRRMARSADRPAVGTAQHLAPPPLPISREKARMSQPVAGEEWPAGLLGRQPPEAFSLEEAPTCGRGSSLSPPVPEPPVAVPQEPPARPLPNLRPPAPDLPPTVVHPPEPPRVIIGRLSIEVVPEPPSVQEQPSARPARPASRAPSRSESPRSMLRFGLGQM